MTPCTPSTTSNAVLPYPYSPAPVVHQVYANDLNPRSAYYMATNVRINRLTGAVRVFNMDGRAFVRMLCDTLGTDGGQLAEQLRQQQQEQQQQKVCQLSCLLILFVDHRIRHSALG